MVVFGFSLDGFGFRAALYLPAEKQDLPSIE
jgi:hypothetical protein